MCPTDPRIKLVAGQNNADLRRVSPVGRAVRPLPQLRQKLNQEPGDDDWVVWGRWFLADRATRTISPFSKLTVPEYIENRIKEKTLQSLDEAEQLAVDNPELLQRISEARRTLEQTK